MYACKHVSMHVCMHACMDVYKVGWVGAISPGYLALACPGHDPIKPPSPRSSEAHRHCTEAEDKAEFLATVVGLRNGFAVHAS